MGKRKLITILMIFIVVFLALGSLNVSRADVGVDKFTLKLSENWHSQITWTPADTTFTGTYDIRYQLNHDSKNETTKNIWHLEPTDPTVAEQIQNIYCIRAGLGFASDDGHAAGTEREYSLAGTLPADYESLRTRLTGSDANIFEAEQLQNLNAMLWIVDNMALDSWSNEELSEYIFEHGYKAIGGDYDSKDAINYNPTKPPYYLLTKEDIEAVQQMAIWHFTNYDEDVYKEDTLGNLYVNVSNYKLNGRDQSNFDTQSSYPEGWTSMSQWINDKGLDQGSIGTERQQAAANLYKWLIETAKSSVQGLNEIYKSERTVNVYWVGTSPTTEQPVISVEEAPKISIKVNKNWDDFENLEDLRGNFKFKLFAKVDGVETDIGLRADELEVELTPSNKEKVWENLPRTKGGKEIVYSVDETEVPAGYTHTVVLNEDESGRLTYNYVFDVTNSHRWADISLRKFISKVNQKTVTPSREPEVDTTYFNTKVQGELQKTAIYNHPKNAVPVSNNALVTYTIRVYNEGSVDAQVHEVMDSLPSYLEFVPNDPVNVNNWEVYEEADVDNHGDVTLKTKDTCTIVNAGGKLTMEGLESKTLKDVTIPAAVQNAGQSGKDRYTLSYVDIEVVCRVKLDAPAGVVQTNLAQVTKMTEDDGETPLEDRDSEEKNLKIPTEDEKPTYKDNKPGPYVPGDEDDDDFDKVVVTNYDIALRKFIDKINDKTVTPSRAPVVDTSTFNDVVTVNGQQVLNTTATYNHPKNPVEIDYGAVITYTLRIYNEGSEPAHVKEVMDHLPEGLEFIENNAINQANWEVVTGEDTAINHEGTSLKTKSTCTVAGFGGKLKASDVQGKTLGDILLPAAVENQDKAEDAADRWTLSYVDVQIVCRIKDDATPNKIQTNLAEVTNMTDENDEPLPDRDSDDKDVTVPEEPDKPTYKDNEDGPYVPGQEDDDDFEKVVIRRKIKIKVNKNWDDFDNLDEIRDSYTFTLKATVNNQPYNLGIDDATVTLTATGTQEYAWTDLYDLTEDGKQITYTVEETEVPEGYTATVEVVTNSDGSSEYNYVFNVTNSHRWADISLRKFISEVNGDAPSVSREPQVDTTKLNKWFGEGEAREQVTTAEYNHTKEPLKVQRGDKVTYTIRIYNEGTVDANVREVMDHLPANLEMDPNAEENKGIWQVVKDTRNPDAQTLKSSGNCIVVNCGGNFDEDVTGQKLADVMIPAATPNYNADGSIKDWTLSYVDVEVVCTVVPAAKSGVPLTNIAEVTDMREGPDDEDEPLPDRDSDDDVNVPDEPDKPEYKDKEEGPYVPGQEDDDDFEKVVVEGEFDLALRKFITKIEDTDVMSRIPQVVYDPGDEDPHYVHPKDPILVNTGDTVIYTLRIFNEGGVDGYANEITDDVPEGLEFLPDHEINKEYRWVLLDENEQVTTDVSKAKYIITDYLSEEQEQETGRDNLIRAFDKTAPITDDNPDYRDVKIAFKVTFKAESKEDEKRILVNEAQISKDSDDDEDSEPNRDEVYDRTPEPDNEDDIDYENVKVKYFDLALLKWVSEAQVTLNGKTEVVQGNTIENTYNEPPIKIEIEEKNINKVIIKYKYILRITNEGEVEGWADEIRDYIPEGLRFEESDNTEWGWKMQSDGTITTDYLKDTLLYPGDWVEVPVVLTWNNNKDNLGTKINTAEISKDRNVPDIPDVDSKPDNKVWGEDDIDDAPVLLATKTGRPVMYVGLMFTSLAIIATGVGGIKRYVLG